jgi:hypothetical protein
MLGRYLIVLLVIAGALVTAVAHRSASPLVWPEKEGTAQLKFSHAFHVGEAGVACADCHAAKDSKLASDHLKAGHDQCSSCHEEQIANTCGYCHVDPENIVPAPAPVREIVFSHAQHAAMEGVACETCHQGLDKADLAGPAAMPSMETCATCHNDVRATNACEACHLKLTDLIPSDHLVAGFEREHKRLTRVGGIDAQCSMCHRQDFCADCHSAAASVQFGMGPLMADPSPRGSPTDSPNKMILQFAHDLNYRHTHGIDAKSVSADCYSCHNYQQFCVTCHMEGEKLAGPGYVPAWHLGSGFALVGRGSGGGRHADVARRDLESCITCHDVVGGDATCMRCHIDPDGIKGTDPRTHPVGFREGDHGEWHEDPGATCYTCHTDLNARPDGAPTRGFCGYCHGS